MHNSLAIVENIVEFGPGVCWEAFYNINCPFYVFLDTQRGGRRCAQQRGHCGEHSRVPASSVADPDLEPDPDGSETFGLIWIRSGTEINVSDPDSDPYSNPESNPDPELDPKKICKKEHYFQVENKLVSHDYTYFTFTSSSNNRCTVENIYR